MAYATLTLGREAQVATVTLNRPEVHNALNADLVRELRDVFRTLAADEDTRVVVLTGAGLSFCAGADLGWMQAAVNYSVEENIAPTNQPGGPGRAARLPGEASAEVDE